MRPVVGILAVASPEAIAIRLRAFREGLRVAGYVEGQNVNIEYRWAEAHTDRLPELAAELVRDQVAVLVAAGGTASALTAKAATGSIPIVFGIAADPVSVGLVASLTRLLPSGPEYQISRDAADRAPHGWKTAGEAELTEIGSLSKWPSLRHANDNKRRL